MTQRCIDFSTADDSVVVFPCREVSGEVDLPGDKSISHRAVLFSLLGEGRARVSNLSASADVASSVAAVRLLGGRIELADRQSEVPVEGYLEGRAPLLTHNLDEYSEELLVSCGNSGTTMRLLAGILAGRPGRFVLVGDDSLSQRPMKRVVDPLSAMGARITLPSSGTAPIQIEGSSLTGGAFTLPVASAQVKSALLLAGLSADGSTTVREPAASRDHTERLLKHLGADISLSTDGCVVKPSRLQMRDIDIPADPSAASFFAVAVALVGGEIAARGVSSNPTRTGFFDVLASVGVQVTSRREETVSGEPRSNLAFRREDLRAIEIDASSMPGSIDEIPLLGVVGSLAPGTTRVTGAGELRVKESDRISVLVDGLRAAGVAIRPLADGFEVEGGPVPKGGCTLDPAGDHRMAMAFAVLALACEEPVKIRDASCVKVSDPGFWDTLARVGVPRGLRG